MPIELRPLTPLEAGCLELIDNGNYLKRLQAKLCAVIEREFAKKTPNRDKLNAATKLFRYTGLGVENGSQVATQNNFFVTIKSAEDARRVFDLAGKAAIPAGFAQRAITDGERHDSGEGEAGCTVVGAELHKDV